MNTDVVVADVIGDIALVTASSTLLSAAARKLGQAGVIGQIFTGVLLGPSILGRLPGHVTAHLFPHYVLPYLSVLSQVAVAIFMFIVGYEIEFRSLRGYGKAISLIASGSLLIPMGLGAGAVLLYRSGFTAAGEHEVSSRSFVLFLSVATSITALPVLAAIVRERGLAGTAVGFVATSAAGIMDVAAWLILAAALIGKGHSSRLPWLATAGLLMCFVALMLFGVRPALRWWTGRKASLLSNHVIVAMTLAMGSAWVTAALGLHPIFGAFLAGLTMRGQTGPHADVLRSMEQAGNLLLPLFFVVTGLSLDISGLGSGALVLLVIIVAISAGGKLGPAYAASRLGGLDRRQSAGVAALLNTRGLTELIALNVGLNEGIIHQQLFTVLVLMALITTVMTAPLLKLIRLPQAQAPAGAASPSGLERPIVDFCP
jgi:Kef-type K+ transport system membrane component KefB